MTRYDLTTALGRHVLYMDLSEACDHHAGICWRCLIDHAAGTIRIDYAIDHARRAQIANELRRMMSLDAEESR